VKKLDKKFARKVLNELNRKLLLLSAEQKTVKRMDIVDSILEERKGASIEQQGEEKQLKLLFGLDKK